MTIASVALSTALAAPRERGAGGTAERKASRVLATGAATVAASATGLQAVGAEPPAVVPISAAASQGASTATPEPGEVLAPTQESRLTFRALGMERPITLRGSEGEGSVGLDLRLDEAVVTARLNLTYTLSPTLLPELSHLKVLFNDEVLHTIAIDKARLGSPQTVSLDIDPRYFTDYNRLRFQLIGHYTLECESSNHTSLWASISNQSSITLKVRKLALRDDLALLPAPFFDPRDRNAMLLPVVYGASPNFGLLKAGGMVAGWAGALAAYRGARFPVLQNALPEGNAVVVATNATRPDFLRDVAAVDRPTLAILPHPARPGAKLLLVLGTDEAQVQEAAQALIHTPAALSGRQMAVSRLQVPGPLAAYDAPRWASSERPVRFSELVRYPEALNLRGAGLDGVVTVPIRTAPDLFTWNSKGIPLNLSYRYTPTTVSETGALNVSIDGQFVRSYPLRSRGDDASTGVGKVFLPMLDEAATLARSDLKLPAFLIGGDNQLQFNFQIPSADAGRCSTVRQPELRAGIDPASTVDLTDFGHYIAMPNLAAYGNSGFPFTKFADLAQTVFVLPDRPTPSEMELYFTALGRLGAITGIAGTRFTLLPASRWQEARGHDILLIAQAGTDKVLAEVGRDLPTLIGKGQRSVTPTQRLLGTLSELFNLGHKDPIPADAGRIVLDGDGAIAAMVGFESPLTAGRSVLALTASSDAALDTLSRGLIDPGKLQALRGDVGFFTGDTVRSYRVGGTYYVGDLAWWRRLWYHVHAYPLVLALMGVVSGLFMTLLVYVALRARARRRIGGDA